MVAVGADCRIVRLDFGVERNRVGLNGGVAGLHALREGDPLLLEGGLPPIGIRRLPRRPRLRRHRLRRRHVRQERVVDEDDRQIELHGAAVEIGGGILKPVRRPVDARPEHPLARGRQLRREIDRARTNIGLIQVGRHRREQADARERHLEVKLARIVVAVQRRFGELHLAFARDDEQPLTQVGGVAASLLDGRLAVSVARAVVELALAHLDERDAVSERVRKALVHHPHVVVAPHRRAMDPFLDRHAGRNRPRSARIEPPAESREHEQVRADRIGVRAGSVP